ncbi:TPA: phenolic acid decarboxylase, partial [Neisseria gonorrhoeae]
MLNRVFYRILGVADNLYPCLSDFCFFTIIAGLPLQAVLWERR